MSYEESIKLNTEYIRPLLAKIDSDARAADQDLAKANVDLDEAQGVIEEVSAALRYSEDSVLGLVEWADYIYNKAHTPVPNKDERVRGWACWGSLYGGKSWDERAACNQVDHLSVTQKWNKWSVTTGFSQPASSAKKYGKGFWIAIHPGLGPELPPEIQSLVPQDQRVSTVVKSSTSWLCPWWIDSVRNAWLRGPIKEASDLHGSDPQLRMIRATMPPMQSGEPYFDGSPNSANMAKWLKAWKASGRGVGQTDDQIWSELCDNYYKTFASVIEYIATSFPPSVMIAVAAGIGMGDTVGNRLSSMLESLLDTTRARVCLQHNGLNDIAKVADPNIPDKMVWSPQGSTDEWVLLTEKIAKKWGLVLGYQTVSGALGGGPGPIGPQGLEKALQVGSDLGMSYCEIYGIDIDAITVAEGNVNIAEILDKLDRTP